MTDPRNLALIHAEIDGELDAAGRAELARWTLSDPAGRKLREDLGRLCAALDSLPPVEPPPELRANVLAALPHSAVPQRSSWIPDWRYAALAAGVVIGGIVVLQSVRGPGPAPSEVTGTMSASPATLVDTVQIANGAMSGHVSLYRDSSGLGLRFDLVTSSPIDVLVTGGGHSLRVNGLGATSNPAAGTTVGLAGFAGDVQIVDLTFLLGGHQLGSATLHAAPER